MKGFWLFALAGVLLASGCGKNKDERRASPVAAIREASRESGLQNKRFAGECFSSPVSNFISSIMTAGSGAIKSGKVNYEFLGAAVTRTTSLFSEPNCQGPEAIAYRQKGSFRILDDPETNERARAIDLSYRNLEAEAVTDAGVNVASQLKLCRIDNWPLKTVQDVTGQAVDRTCFDQEMPVVDHNIYRLDGKTLYLGKRAGLGASADLRNRPTELNFDERYVAE